jgi:hypothetical protein
LFADERSGCNAADVTPALDGARASEPGNAGGALIDLLPLNLPVLTDLAVSAPTPSHSAQGPPSELGAGAAAEQATSSAGGELGGVIAVIVVHRPVVVPGSPER